MKRSDLKEFSHLTKRPYSRKSFLPSLGSASRGQKPSLTSTTSLTSCKWVCSWEILFHILARFGYLPHIGRKTFTQRAWLLITYIKGTMSVPWPTNSWECRLWNWLYVSDCWFCYIYLKQGTILDWCFKLLYKYQDLLCAPDFWVCVLVATAGCRAEYICVNHPLLPAKKVLDLKAYLDLPGQDNPHMSLHSVLEKEHFFPFLKKFCWSVADLQCCNNFYCTIMWLSYTCTHSHSLSAFFPRRLSQRIG